jgi:membrane protease YdiL (CAAX protease family)
VVGGALFLFLLARGWTFKRLGLTTQLWDGPIGLALAFLSVAAYVLLWNVLVLTFPDAAHLAASVRVVRSGIPVAVTLTLPWINGLFEEVFISGYVISALKERWGEQVAINVSVALRLSYHLYQSAAGVIAILPLGLLFGYWYARTGRLWPLIVAHAALDLIAFLAYTQF